MAQDGGHCGKPELPFCVQHLVFTAGTALVLLYLYRINSTLLSGSQHLVSASSQLLQTFIAEADFEHFHPLVPKID